MLCGLGRIVIEAAQFIENVKKYGLRKAYRYYFDSITNLTETTLGVIYLVVGLWYVLAFYFQARGQVKCLDVEVSGKDINKLFIHDGVARCIEYGDYYYYDDNTMFGNIITAIFGTANKTGSESTDYFTQGCGDDCKEVILEGKTPWKNGSVVLAMNKTRTQINDTNKAKFFANLAAYWMTMSIFFHLTSAMDFLFDLSDTFKGFSKVLMILNFMFRKAFSLFVLGFIWMISFHLIAVRLANCVASPPT